jgi:hypothetical protein
MKLHLTIAALCAFPLAAARSEAQVTVDKSAAREHWAKAKAAWDAQRREEAARELDAAYRLWPDPAMLYNIGALNVELGRPVEAVEALEKYLEQERATIAPARRKSIEAAIDKQMALLGTVEIRTSPDGVAVAIDGKQMGKTPLPRALRATTGAHLVELTREGHVTQQRQIDVQARGRLVLDVNLPPSPALSGTPPAAVPPPGPQLVPTAPVITESAGAEQRSLTGAVIAGGGVVTAIVGGALALKYTSDANSAASEAMGNAQAWERAMPDYDRAKDRRMVGLALVGVGALATAVGSYLFFGRF